MVRRKGTKAETAHKLCQHCRDAKYLNQEDFTSCEICGNPVISRHRPPYKICPSCAERENRCEQCGESLDF